MAAVSQILAYVRLVARQTRIPETNLVAQLVLRTLKRRAKTAQINAEKEATDPFAYIADRLKQMQDTLDSSQKGKTVNSELRDTVLTNLHITDLHSGLGFTPTDRAFVVKVKAGVDYEEYEDKDKEIVKALILPVLVDSTILVLGQYDDLFWIGISDREEVGILPKKIVDVERDEGEQEKQGKFVGYTFNKAKLDDMFRAFWAKVSDAIKNEKYVSELTSLQTELKQNVLNLVKPKRVAYTQS